MPYQFTWLSLTVGFAAGGVSLLRAQSTEPATAFVHVAVVPMDRERVLHDQTVVVRGDRIVALGSANRVTVPAGAVQIDGRGKFLIPGLSDMHVHLRDRGAGDEASLLLFVANGVTTVRDMHSGRRGDADGSSASQDWLFQLRRRVAAGELIGPRIYTAGDPDDSSPEAAAKTVTELKADGHDFVKLYAFPSPTYDSVVAAAHRVGLPVVGHVPATVGLERVLRDRWASIEHLTGYFERLLGYNPVGVFGQDLVRLADTAGWMKPDYRLPPAELRAVAAATHKAGVWNCPTLKTLRLQGEGTMPPDDSLAPNLRALVRVMRRLHEFGGWVTKALHDAGAGLLLGTDVGDGASTDMPPGFGVARELQELVRAGLTPYQALEVGTRNAAVFLRTQDSVGTVAAGKRADLVLLNGNPVADIGYAAGPAGVMTAGRWLPRALIDAKLDSLKTWSRGEGRQSFDLTAVRRAGWKPVAP